MRTISLLEGNLRFPCPPEFIKQMTSRKGLVQYCLDTPRFGRGFLYPTYEEALGEWRCYSHPDVSYDDWKEISEENFAEINRHLKPFGLEVVQIHFDGDSYVWFIDKALT